MPDMSSVDRPRSRDAARRARLAYLTVSALSKMDPPVLVVPDTETAEVSVGPDFLPADLVVQHLDIRLRLILLIDVSDPNMLPEPHRLRAAALLLKHWPETAAVGLVANDAQLSCLVLEPFDVEPSIATPSGLRLPPTPRRGTAPVTNAIRAYLEVVVPNWERVPPPAERDAVGYEELGPPIAHQVQADIVERRANIDEKRAALDSIDQSDTRWAADVLLRVSSKGMSAEALAQEIERRTGKRP